MSDRAAIAESVRVLARRIDGIVMDKAMAREDKAEALTQLWMKTNAAGRVAFREIMILHLAGVV